MEVNVCFSNGFTFRQRNFDQQLLLNELKFSKPAPNELKIPYVAVNDAAFPLLENLMRPFANSSMKTNISNRIFHYKPNHACQTIQCAYGIVTA